MFKGSKRLGCQACDACGREFEVTGKDNPTLNRDRWGCPHCGFDNKQSFESIQHGLVEGKKRAAKRRSAGQN